MDELAGKLFLPAAIVTAATVMPASAPPEIVVEIPEQPAPVIEVVVEPSAFPEFPAFPKPVASSVTVEPAEPVIVEETTERIVEVPGDTETVYVDREVIVEVPVRTWLVWDELPSWDLSRAISAARPGESWSLSGDYYSGLVWHDSTPKPSETELIAGWLESLEAQCS